MNHRVFREVAAATPETQAATAFAPTKAYHTSILLKAAAARSSRFFKLSMPSAMRCHDTGAKAIALIMRGAVMAP